MASSLSQAAPQTAVLLSLQMSKADAAALPLLPAKPAAAHPAAAAAPADAWSIPALQPCASECSGTSSQEECEFAEACCAILESLSAPTGCMPSCTAASDAATPSLSLDLELGPDEAQWLVQPPALLEHAPATSSPSSPPKQPATTPAATKRPAAAPLAALRRGLRRLAGGLRRRLAAAACMARPATLECGGCPGRRLGNASSGASAEWTVVHVNWS